MFDSDLSEAYFHVRPREKLEFREFPDLIRKLPVTQDSWGFLFVSPS